MKGVVASVDQTYFCSLSQYHLLYCSMYRSGLPHVGHMFAEPGGGGGAAGPRWNWNFRKEGIGVSIPFIMPAKNPPIGKNISANTMSTTQSSIAVPSSPP